jgi:parallel beta-helix repeat protein
MRKSIKIILVLSMLLASFVLPSMSMSAQTQGAGLDPFIPNYYVSLSGNDLNSGSFDAPFRTLAKATSVLQAGDTLRVMEGTYNETLKVSQIGLSNFPITILGAGAVLDGEGVIQNVIDTTGDHIVIDGFEITRAKGFGTFNTGSHNIFQNNVVHHNVTSNMMINGDCKNNATAGWGSAMKDKLGADNSIYRFNSVYSNCGEGIAITRGVVSTVTDNTVGDNFVGGIYVDNSPFVVVANNTIFCTVDAPTWNGNIMHAVSVGEESYSGWGAQLHDVLITNNTMRDCRTGLQVVQSDVGGTLTNFLFDNNTVFSATKRSVSLDNTKNVNVKITNNKLYALDWWVRSSSGVTLSGNTVIGVDTPTPVFVTPTAIKTPTPIIPTVTKTSTAIKTPTPAIPTVTMTPTRTPVPATQTPTASPIPPTGTISPPATNTPIFPATPAYECLLFPVHGQVVCLP